MRSTVPGARAMPTDVLRTAAQHASAAVPIAAPRDPVAAVLDSLRGKRFDTASMVAVCEGTRLVGLVSLECLLAAPDGAVVAEVMDTDPPLVTEDTAQERAAWVAVRRGEPSLAVVDDAGAFVGLIAPQRLLAVLLAEHDEDLARLGGFAGTASAARSASTERVGRRLGHRLPWLLLGLVGAMLSAGLVGGFEESLQRNVLLAFFVPAIVYMADAVGTQTETLVVRGLSVGVRIGGVVVREILTGLLVGLLLGALALPVTWWLWGDGRVAVAVALALLGACSIATLIAMALPWLLNRLGKDPAYGAGPLSTVIQDLLSIMIYLAVAQAIVG